MIIFAVLSLIIWLFLLVFWGRFWQASEILAPKDNQLNSYPSVTIIIPARNEAEAIPTSLTSLLNQDYAGNFNIILVDDQSSDGTGKIAEEIANNLHKTELLKIIYGQSLPQGWSGKLWAMEQGINAALTQPSTPDYFLFTDADIEHSQDNLRQLVTKAETEKLELVSLMVLLRKESFWEKFLIPAFVFFFAKLYPFPWVNNPEKKTAAAAGGCILISHKALKDIGGIEVVREALIDDCALAIAVKAKYPRIWLGLTQTTRSLRPYDSLATIWDMVARTAFTQLNYSIWLLIPTILGMALVYLVAPVSLLVGIIQGNIPLAITGLVTWALMGYSYYPTLRLYGASWWWSWSLPGIAFLYSLMTVDSAWRYWQGKGGAWKGRVYQIEK